MSVLMVAGIECVKNCAAAIGSQLGMEVQLAENRRTAVAALKKRVFDVVVVDASLAECDPEGADAIWAEARLAIPLQVNFALSNTSRLVREIKAALHRREREQALAGKAAAAALETELKSTIAGLLLNSELALRVNGVPAGTAERLRTVVHLADTLRQQLNTRQAVPGGVN